MNSAGSSSGSGALSALGEATRRLLGHLADGLTFVRALRADPRVPRDVRWVLGGALASLVSPIDVIPDFIPVVGQLDDAAILAFAVRYAAKRVPREAIMEAWPGEPAFLERVLKLLGVPASE